MTIAEWCVFGTLMLYLLTIASVKWIGYRHFDNARPREPSFYEDAIRARALGAHQNGIEAFPFFAVAVLLAEFRLAPQHLIDELAAIGPRFDRSCGASALRSTSRFSFCRRSEPFCRRKVVVSGSSRTLNSRFPGDI